MMHRKEETAPLPGVVTTITAGFDLTVKRFWLILIPVLVDSFYWLGPRLSFRSLIEWVATFWQQEEALAEMSQQLLALASRTNLFTSLSVPVIGIPALMAGATPEKTPLTPRVVEIESFWLWALLFVGFNVLGLLLTAVYYSFVARAARQQKQDAREPVAVGLFLRQVGLAWLQLLGLALVFLMGVFIIYLPLLIIGTFLAFFSSGLASVVLLMGTVVVMWWLIFLSFTPHGLMLNGRSFWRAPIESMQLVRRHLLPTLSLFLAIFLISTLLDWLLLLADDGSWLTFSSILGHAYVSTSLLAATFIFYQDRFAALYGNNVKRNA